MSLSFSTLSAVACGVWASAKSPRPKSCGFRDTTFPAYDLETRLHTHRHPSLTRRAVVAIRRVLETLWKFQGVHWATMMCDSDRHSAGVFFLSIDSASRVGVSALPLAVWPTQVRQRYGCGLTTGPCQIFHPACPSPCNFGGARRECTSCTDNLIPRSTSSRAARTRSAEVSTGVGWYRARC